MEREFSDPVRVAAGLLSSWLREEGASVLSSGTNLNNMSANTVHLAICLGGDGTLLEVRYCMYMSYVYFLLCTCLLLYNPLLIGYTEKMVPCLYTYKMHPFCNTINIECPHPPITVIISNCDVRRVVCSPPPCPPSSPSAWVTPTSSPAHPGTSTMPGEGPVFKMH